MRLLCVILATSLLASCAVTTGTLRGVTGEWPTTSTFETRHWIDGVPVTDFVVEARLGSPPNVYCERQTRAPAAHVTNDDYTMDSGGLLVYGFMGVAELAIGAALFFIPHDGERCVGCDVAGTFFALDGVASLLMAFLIPDEHYHRERDEPARSWVDQVCPADIALEAAGRAFPVQPDGQLIASHAQSLMLAVVETGSAIALRFGDRQTWTEVPPELRCRWAVELHSQLAPALCPHGPP